LLNPPLAVVLLMKGIGVSFKTFWSALISCKSAFARRPVSSAVSVPGAAKVNL
jgi:hypothetical protein